MTPIHSARALKCTVELELASGLMLRSGEVGDFADSTIERDPEGRLHINGYVWASLLRRALSRTADSALSAEAIGGYAPEDGNGISPLWCEASFVPLAEEGEALLEIRPGIRISRKWGAAAEGALYADEIVPPGYRAPLSFVYFCDDPQTAETDFLSAFQVIDQGIETIGGGWSYGHGRLRVKQVRTKHLDLHRPEHRNQLWEWKELPWDRDEPWTSSVSDLKSVRADTWHRFSVTARVMEGQLLAVTTGVPPLDFQADRLPDTFVFRRPRAGDPVPEIVVPGKAIRQALLSVPIGRRLRSKDEKACAGPGPENCGCLICRWFGAVDRRGIVTVADAPVEGAETVLLNRVQLCEHSMQNVQLFTGEYLSAGRFSFDILVNRIGLKDSAPDELIAEIRRILQEMTPDTGQAPPGWHRLGGTATCTGQVAVESWTETPTRKEG